MSCFDGLIGVKNICSNPYDKILQSSSGLWLQSLKGFQGIKIVDASLNEETRSSIDLIRQCLDNAILEISIQIRTHLESKTALRSIVDNDTVGIFQDDRRLRPVQSGYWVGTRIRLRRKSNYEFFLSEINLLLNVSKEIDVKLFDLSTGETLDTFTFDTQAGIPTMYHVNKSYLKEKQTFDLFLGYLSEDQSLNTLMTSCGSCTASNAMLFTPARILDTDQKIINNIKSGTDTGGLSFNYSLSCAFEPFLCNSANRFAWPLLHKWGANIMAEAKYSSNFNTLINLQRENNEELYTLYENEYMASIGAILNNMILPDDICFKCKSPVRTRVQIP